MSHELYAASAVAFLEARKSLGAKTPALPKERIKGSTKNKSGSASNTRGGIKITKAVEDSLREKVRKHNEKYGDQKGKKINLGQLKAVWRRGAGAFSATHRPGMGRQQWAMGRVNAWLQIVRTGSPKSAKYVGDNDLLPKGHPRKASRSVDFDLASGFVFLESRAKNCGTGAGGFKKGNSCAADAAKSAAKGAVTGAAIAAGAGFTDYPPGLLIGAGAGAAVGFVKGIYDNKKKPTEIARRMEKVSTTEEKLNKFVKSLGGSSDSVLDTDGKKDLVLSVKDQDKKTQYTVDIKEKSITVYPRCKLDCLTTDRINEIKEFAKGTTEREVKIVVKPKRGDYTKRVASRLTKAGFKVAGSAAAQNVVATLAVPTAVYAGQEAMGLNKPPKRKST